MSYLGNPFLPRGHTITCIFLKSLKLLLLAFLSLIHLDMLFAYGVKKRSSSSSCGFLPHLLNGSPQGSVTHLPYLSDSGMSGHVLGSVRLVSSSIPEPICHLHLITALQVALSMTPHLRLLLFLLQKCLHCYFFKLSHNVCIAKRTDLKCTVHLMVINVCAWPVIRDASRTSPNLWVLRALGVWRTIRQWGQLTLAP